jgi:hypothetical protein
VRIVGTVYRCKKAVSENGVYLLTHHQAFDILHSLVRNCLLHQHHPYARPSQHDAAEPNRDEPIQRAELVRATEDDMERRRVDDEHAETRAGKDAGEVPLVSDSAATEGEAEVGFHREYLYACQ